MGNRRFKVVLCIVSMLLGQTLLVAQSPSTPRVRRAAPPKFDETIASGIFFKDVFQEGLVGARPGNLGVPAVLAETSKSGAAPSVPSSVSGAGSSGSESTEGVFPWSKIISATTIEDAIKSIKLSVDRDVTTPGDFAGKGYKLARRHFTMLAMLFAIAGEYDGPVRWHDDAPAARDAFARTAANCKVGTPQVYNEATQRKAQLQDMVGGARLPAGPASPQADWGQVCDRSPLMQRLEIAQQSNLQPATASKAEFAANSEEILHEAEIVAAIGEVLQKEGMVDADDSDYTGYAEAMKKAALEIVEAVKSNSDEQARKAVGEISKACSQCHENYRA